MTTRRWRAAAALDLLGVVLFVVIGRASHHHGESGAGIASTAWPFVVGLGAGWLVVLGAEKSPRVRRVGPGSLAGGVTVCVATVGIGMVLRVIAGQGTAPAFIGVATGFLGAVMVIGRMLIGAADRHSRAARR